MGDLMTGADSIEDGNNFIQLISQELQKVGLNLRKWISTTLKLMQTVGR